MNKLTKAKDSTPHKASRSKEKKAVIIAQMAEKVQKAKAMVFANYAGMTHVQLEQLKKSLKHTQAEMVVTKNTLLARSLQISNFKFQISNLSGPTATLFAYEDIIAPIKELAKSIKSLKLPLIKFGILDGKVISEQDVTKLATIPSKEVLLAQLVGGLKSPIFGLHRALSWNLQKLVMTLQVISDKKKATS